MHKKHIQSLFTVFVAFMLIAAPAARGQSNEGATRTQADDILKELRLIRQLLERQQAPQAPPKPSVGSVAIPSTDPVLGNKNAPITLVEYTDYQFGHVGVAFADLDAVLADVSTEEATAHPERFFE